MADNCAIVINGKADGQLSDLRPDEKLVFNYDEINGVNVVNRIAPAEEQTNSVASIPKSSQMTSLLSLALDNKKARPESPSQMLRDAPLYQRQAAVTVKHETISEPRKIGGHWRNLCRGLFRASHGSFRRACGN